MASNNPFMPNAGGAPMPAPAGVSASDAFEIDLTDVQDSGFTVPDGAYEVECIEVTQDVSKGGNPMFVWDFEISKGSHKGFKSKVFTAITPAAMWKVAETVQALGVGQTGEVVKFKRTDVIGKKCGAQFEITEYNGQSRSQITKVMSLKDLAEAEANVN